MDMGATSVPTTSRRRPANADSPALPPRMAIGGVRVGKKTAPFPRQLYNFN
jgi:hypothetical protein